MKHKRHNGIAFRISFGIILTCVLIAGSIIYFGNYFFKGYLSNLYVRNTYNIATMAETFLSKKQILTYSNILEEYNITGNRESIISTLGSDSYKDTVKSLNTLKEKMKASDIYVFAIQEEVLQEVSESHTNKLSLTYMFDTFEDEKIQVKFGDDGYLYLDDQFIQKFISIDNDSPDHACTVESSGDMGGNISLFYPYKIGEDTLAYIGVDIPISAYNHYLISYRNYVLLLSFAITIVMLLLIILYMRKRIINPINTVSDASQNFIKNNAEISSDLSSIQTNDEIQYLAESVLKMENDIQEYVSNISKIATEREHIRTELNVAYNIQADMLPKVFPDDPRYKIFGKMIPAKGVGGDFFDFFMVDDSHLLLTIADVSGKGIPAALFMAKAKTLIKITALQGYSPAKILQIVNNELCENNTSEFFVTVWLALIDINTGEGIAANAGHEHPVLYQKDGAFELVKYRHSPAVATMENIRFREHPFSLQEGDCIFVYTDGVPEATSVQKELFGTDRMLDSLNKHKEQDLEELLVCLKEDIDTFVEGAEQFDDITMLAFLYKKKE